MVIAQFIQSMIILEKELAVDLTLHYRKTTNKLIEWCGGAVFEEQTMIALLSLLLPLMGRCKPLNTKSSVMYRTEQVHDAYSSRM